MEPEDFIIEQLRKQEIGFKLLQKDYDPTAKSLVSKIVKKCKDEIIGNRTAPNLDSYLWHIFSFDATSIWKEMRHSKSLKNN